MKAVAALLLVLTLGSCATETSADRLVGTWETPDEPRARITYEPDGTWHSSFVIEVEGNNGEYLCTGTWKVEGGAIHSTTRTADDIPGMESIELPYLSIEKLVSVDEREYRYVCPVQHCTNTMRRVDE